MDFLARWSALYPLWRSRVCKLAQELAVLDHKNGLDPPDELFAEAFEIIGPPDAIQPDERAAYLRVRRLYARRGPGPKRPKPPQMVM